MGNYLNYIIESGISLGVFTLIYWLMLRKETLLKAGRVYLLVALFFSSVLPFITFRYSLGLPLGYGQQGIVDEQNASNLLDTVTIFASGLPSKMSDGFRSVNPLIWCYKVGVIAALAFLLSGFIQVAVMLFRNRVFKLKNARLVLHEKRISPFSFFNFVFISSDLPRHENWKVMVQHELEHARQGHSIDILFVDFMMVFQWFNPFYWIIRHLIRENHEFLADRAVLARGRISTGHYKALLLSQVIGGKPILTSNFFNIETIKKRFKMITNNHTGRLSFLKYTIGLVAALAITLLFACEKSEQATELKYNPERSLVYHDKLIDFSEVKAQNIKEMFLAQVETKLIIEQFPHLKGTLPEGEVLMMFDTSNPDDMELAKKFNLMVTKPKKMEMVQGVAPDDDVFVIVEVMPEFPGGEKALRTFIANNIKYPEDCKLNGIQGRVYVQFVVDANGKVVNPRIARGVHPSLDAEALRVIGVLPDWKPGTQKGVPVKVNYTVPINFVVQ